MEINKNNHWVAMFSQTGSEIALISDAIGRWPDLIVTNKQSLEDVNVDLMNTCGDKILQLPKWPKYVDYLKIADQLGYSILNEKWREESIVTLHGYLRILPEEFCDNSRVYNGHPGLITEYPELKGFNPQEKVWKGYHQYDEVGCVIHEVIPELDSGDVIAVAKSENTFDNLSELTLKLHDMSVKLWIDFLKDKI